MTATVTGSATAVRARAQHSHLHSLFGLSMMMFDGRGEEAIVRLALRAATRLARCRAEFGCLVREGTLVPVPPEPGAPPDPRTGALLGQLHALEADEGQVHLPGGDWARAYRLSSLGSRRGYLVISAGRELDRDERYVLSMLAQQTGAALGNAVLHRVEREQAGRLRLLNSELAGVNERLSASLAALQRQRKIHEVLSRVTGAGEGEPGIAAAVHRLTGLAVAVEDRFGNLRAWAGPGCPDPYPKPSGQRRGRLLERAVRAGRPVRDADRLVALARPRHEVLGVLALVDPERVAGEYEVFALEHGAVVLAAELAHQRSLTEVELRTRRDLLDDLLDGAADDSAFARAEALGHDLHQAHRVAVVRWWDEVAGAELGRVVRRVAGDLQLDALITERHDSVVLLAHDPGTEHQCWSDLHRGIARELRCDAGAVGVGGRAGSVAEVCRSHDEALRALAIRQGSVHRVGVTLHDELGVYRVLAAAERTTEIRAFVREWLGPLLDYDEGHRSELVRTLSTYLECGGNYDETAEALTIHRSTLRYRLQRIREVGGRDLGDVDCRFNLHVATRAWRVLDGTG